MKLYPQLENFSNIACYERDRVNHDILVLINRYATAFAIRKHSTSVGTKTTTTTAVGFNFVNTLLIPFSHAVELLNHLILSRLLPPPRLYRLQICKELTFQLDQLVDDTETRFERIDVHTAKYRVELGKLGLAAVTSINEHQTKMDTAIQNAWSQHRFLNKIPSFIVSTPPEIGLLEKHRAIGERARKRVIDVVNTDTMHASFTDEQRSELHNLRSVMEEGKLLERKGDNLIFPFNYTAQDIHIHRNIPINIANERNIPFALPSHILTTLSPDDFRSFKTALIRQCEHRPGRQGKQGHPSFIPAPDPIHSLICTLLDLLEADENFMIDENGMARRSWLRARAEATKRFRMGVRADVRSVVEEAVQVSHMLEDEMRANPQMTAS